MRRLKLSFPLLAAMLALTGFAPTAHAQNTKMRATGLK